MRCFVRGHQYASLCQSSLWKWSHSSKRDELSKVRIRDLTFFRSKARTKMFAKEKLLYQTTSQRTIFHDNCVNKATGGELEIAFSLMTGSPVPILVPEHPLIAQRVSDINKKKQISTKNVCQNLSDVDNRLCCRVRVRNTWLHIFLANCNQSMKLQFVFLPSPFPLPHAERQTAPLKLRTSFLM